MKILKEAETDSGIWVPDNSPVGKDIIDKKAGGEKKKRKANDVKSLEKKISDGLKSNNYSDQDLFNDVKDLIKLYGGR